MANDERRHLLALVADFRVAMLTTCGTDGEIHGRPMFVANVEDDGELVFCTRMDMAKVDEIEIQPRCAVLFQGRTRWVSLSGRARIDTDRARVHRLWRESWRLWFPEGRDDPQIGLVVVHPTEAEYWDESGVRTLRFAVRAVGSLLRREPMSPPEPDQHGKIHL